MRLWARLVVAVVAIGIIALARPEPVAADARTDYLVRLLSTSGTFRVRAQAALSLGRIQGNDEQILEALAVALRDDHPAVRTAAAASLEQRGDPEALTQLRRARRDRDGTVRSAVARAIRSLERLARTTPRTEPMPDSGGGEAEGTTRYYVGVGMPGTSVRGLDRAALGSVRDFIRSQVDSMEGVRIAPERESRSAAQRVLQRERLTGYYLDSSVVRIEDRNGGTRAVVSVIVNTYPGRDMRVILQGAATVQGGGRGDAVERQAIEGALTGALRRLPQALAAGDAHNGG